MPDSLYNHEADLRQVIRKVTALSSVSARKKRLILEYKDEMLAKPDVAGS